jgi:cell division protein FtsI/penicillin-binding protein 2
VSVALILSACSSEPPDPDPVAEAVADALASGDFGGVPLADAAADDVQTAYEELVEGMGDLTPSVDVRAIVADDEHDDAWAVTYDVSWDLAGDSNEPGAEGSDDEAGDDEAGDDEAGDDEAGDDEAGADTSGEGAAETTEWSYTTTARLTLDDTGDDDQWRVEWAPALLHPDLEAGDRLRLRRQSPERAEILGAGGSVLVTDRDVFRIGIDKTRFDDGTSEEDMVASAEALADVVGVDPEGLGERVRATGDQAFVDALTLRQTDVGSILNDIEDIDGAVALPDTMQLAPTREFARPILGTVGDATAEIVEESEGRIQAGDLVGMSGLQRQYDQRLRGTPGLHVQIVPDDGDPVTVHESEPEPGEDLVTTLSLDMQLYAEEVLSEVEPASAIVAIQPSTGDVLVAASGPGSEGYSTATLGQYAPGSTFKVATALALIRAGMNPDSSVQCPDTINIDGREFGNYSAYPDSALGDITLRTALAESCNTAFIGLNGEVPQRAIAEAANSLGLGLGNEADLGYAAFLGSAPDEADGTAHAASMIGQGELLASPLAMATVAASISEGETVVPRLVADAGELVAEPSAPLHGDEAEQLRDMMYEAVDSGSASFLQSVPGQRVGAKTGTAEYGTESPPRTHAWMIAIQADFAVAVFVEDGDSGSQTAGPLLEEFLSGI